MDNRNNPDFPQEDWVKDFFETPGETPESQPLKEALPELTATDELDLEQIIRQTKEEDLEQIIRQTKEEEDLEQIIRQTKEEEDLEQIIRQTKEEEDLEQIIRQTGQEGLASGALGEDPMLQSTQMFQPEDISLSQELPNTRDFAPLSQAGAVPEEEPEGETERLEEQPPVDKPARKRRPQRKSGYGLLGIPHIISTVIWLGIVVAIGVSLGRLVWVAASDMLAFNKPFVSATITVTAGDDLDDIAQQLQDAGLIRYPVLFKFFAEMKGGREEISNGTFTFSDTKLYDYNAVMNNMSPTSSGREEIKNLVIPEGYTCAQIFALLEEKGVCTVAELEEYCANGELKDYWFLEGVERGDRYCLEGYLFPDTYNFYKDDSAAHVIGKMLAGFDNRYTDVMKEKLEPLNQRMAEALSKRGFDQDYIDQHKLTIREVVIIASMIEKESVGGSERFKVSAVIFNRLSNPRNFPKLQIDATIIYALDGNIDPETGKTKPLTSEDLAMDHPYNTYVYDGLTPGPICNPGSASLNAALDPDENDYYFYVYDPNSGEHIFSRTREEHEKAVASVRD